MADTIEIVVKADGRQALANLEKLRVALADVDNKASTGRVREELHSLNRVWALTHREMASGMRLLGITGGLLGGGLVAGLVAGGKALADFSAQGLQLQYLAKELGVGAEALERWRYAGMAAGIGSEQAANDVKNALTKIQDLGRRGGYSDLYQELMKSTSDRTGKALADALYAEVRAGGPEAGFRFMLSELSRFAKEGNQWGVTTIEKALGLQGKGWERGTELIDKIGKVTVVSAEDAARLQLQMALLGLQVSNFTTAIGIELMPVFERMASRFNAWLTSEPGKEFQKAIVDTVKQLETIPWEDVEKGVRSTVSGVVSMFRETKKLIDEDIKTIQRGIETYEDLGRRGDAIRDKWKKEPPGLQILPDLNIWKDWKWKGGTSGRADPGGAGPPPPAAGTTGGTPMRFSGGGGAATDFSSVTRRTKTTEDLNDQMRDVTDEVRRLNDLLRGGGDVARAPGGDGAGGMGPTGGGGGGSSGSSAPYSDSGTPGGGGGGAPGSATPVGASTPFRPAGTTAAMTGSVGSLGYPAGGGGAGSGGTSGFTPVQNLGTASGVNPAGGGGAESTGAYPGSASEAARGGALYQKLLAEFRANPPQGIPPDGARFGITKGTPEEWAKFGVAIAKEESSFDPKTKNLRDVGGSFGVFQYAHNQVEGKNAYDVDASVKAFVRDSNQAARNPGGFGKYGERGSSLLANRFSTIGIHPNRAIRSLPAANQIANAAGGGQPQQAPVSAVSNLKLAQTSDIDLTGMTGADPMGGGRTNTASAPGEARVERQGQYNPNHDPRLREIVTEASKYLPDGWKVSLRSGMRPGDPRHHGGGRALDVDLIDPTGKKLNSYQSPENFKTYQDFALKAREIQQAKYPDLNEKFAWGGYFGGKIGKGGTYGAMDLMHFDTGGTRGTAGSFNKGISQEAARAWGVNAPSQLAGMKGIESSKITTLAVKRNDDDDATRKIVDSSLVNSMASQVMKGKANIDIDVGGAGKQASADDSDKGLFNQTRSKSTPQMPNTPSNTKDDKSAASSEEE